MEREKRDEEKINSLKIHLDIITVQTRFCHPPIYHWRGLVYSIYDYLCTSPQLCMERKHRTTTNIDSVLTTRMSQEKNQKLKRDNFTKRERERKGRETQKEFKKPHDKSFTWLNVSLKDFLFSGELGKRKSAFFPLAVFEYGKYVRRAAVGFRGDVDYKVYTQYTYICIFTCMYIFIISRRRRLSLIFFLRRQHTRPSMDWSTLFTNSLTGEWNIHTTKQNHQRHSQNVGCGMYIFIF